MRFEVLAIEGCPHGVDAMHHLDEALAAEGYTASVEHRLIRTAAEASASAFAGSPTIAIGEADLFPDSGSIEQLACRVYMTPGGLAGAPSVDQIRAAIRALDG